MMKGDLKYGLAGAAIGGILGAVGGGAAGELHWFFFQLFIVQK